MPLLDLHVSDSAPAHYDDLGDSQVNTISTASLGLLKSNETWVTLFHEKCSTRSVPSSMSLSALTFVVGFSTVILFLATQPLSTYHVDALPKPALYLPYVAAIDHEPAIDTAPPASPLCELIVAPAEPVVAPTEPPWSPPHCTSP
jgi:hypothetical protein